MRTTNSYVLELLNWSHVLLVHIKVLRGIARTQLMPRAQHGHTTFVRPSVVKTQKPRGHTITLNQEYFEHACINCISTPKYYCLLYILIMVLVWLLLGYTYLSCLHTHVCTSSSDKEPFFSSTLAANLFTIPTISLA